MGSIGAICSFGIVAVGNQDLCEEVSSTNYIYI